MRKILLFIPFLILLVFVTIWRAFREQMHDLAWRCAIFTGGVCMLAPAPQVKPSRDLEFFNHFRGEPLNNGQPNKRGKDFPLGEGWYTLRLRYNLAVVIGTGAGPVTDGELLYMKDVLLETSQGETITHLPARALFIIAKMKGGTPPRKDAIAAATATYSVDLPIYFVDDRMQRPEDTILDTSRYASISLTLTTGTVADLFTAPGTATVACTLDMDIERSKGLLPKLGKPAFFPQFSAQQSQDASVQVYIDIDRSPDIGYKRFFAHASANGVAGGVFTGANADDVQSFESIQDQSGFIMKERIHEMIQNCNKQDYSVENVFTGVTIFDFVRDGSHNSAMYAGNRSRLQYIWTNKAGVAAGDVVSLAYEAIRALK